MRETLFNWLGQDLTGRTTLDPFAGSGALSFEALSRGAALAVAVDRERALVHATRSRWRNNSARARSRRTAPKRTGFSGARRALL